MLSILSNSTVGTLIGTIVGALSSIATTLLANKYELKRRREERYSIRLEKLRQSQINELAAFEKHVVSWGRQMTRYYWSIIKKLRQEREVSASVHGDLEASELMRTEQVQIAFHSGLILDARIREAIQDLTGDPCLSNDAEELEGYVHRKTLELGTVSELLGARHRKLLLLGLSKEDIAVYGGTI